MTLLLDGEYVRAKNLNATGSLRIESADLSGQSSSTDKAHNGFKPKTLAFTGLIPYTQADWLQALMKLAEATASGGQLKTYRIVNDTAAAFGVRQVQFSEGVSAREGDSIRAWTVQFTLTEYLSNPERVENRQAAKATAAQSASGQAVAAPGDASTGTSAGDGQQELTGFESVLGKIDKWIGS